ncbi:hypothetical protein C900_04075 [Fulvivirga imtechensis AK7]|uniref:Uncharacterized protein n=1 Tax=Fulvivirga imtechensis AK7 TaxID=1237149 RepID=L8JPE1_9BACT|nr:hypothetical protein C900_04075 [Fulvivirga imtechensis AK7]
MIPWLFRLPTFSPVPYKYHHVILKFLDRNGENIPNTTQTRQKPDLM